MTSGRRAASLVALTGSLALLASLAAADERLPSRASPDGSAYDAGYRCPEIVARFPEVYRADPAIAAAEFARRHGSDARRLIVEEGCRDALTGRSNKYTTIVRRGPREHVRALVDLWATGGNLRYVLVLSVVLGIVGGRLRVRTEAIRARRAPTRLALRLWSFVGALAGALGFAASGLFFTYFSFFKGVPGEIQVLVGALLFVAFVSIIELPSLPMRPMSERQSWPPSRTS